MSVIPLLLSLVFALVPTQSRFAILGSVRDPGGQPVGSIRVTLLGENYQNLGTRFADSSGRFQFRNLGQGTYTIRIEPAGTPYEEETQTIELQSLSPRRSTTEEPFMVDFRLRQKGGNVALVAPGVVFVQEVPALAREEYERGRSSLNSQNPEMALASLKKAIDIFPDYFLALELLGTEYVRREQFNDAVPVLTRAIQVNPNAARSLYALGVINLKSNRSTEAINWLLLAEDKNPKNPNVHMMLGLAYGNVGSLVESEQAFKKAYLLGGGKSEVAIVHFYLAVIYNRQRRYSEAVRELELFLKEAEDVKDRTQINGLIERLQAKAKAGD
jgi:cytochrome c-type biogenesis protein CcmH/NrfG